jgi:hypothetical protein
MYLTAVRVGSVFARRVVARHADDAVLTVTRRATPPTLPPAHVLTNHPRTLPVPGVVTRARTIVLPSVAALRSTSPSHAGESVVVGGDFKS